MKNLIFLAVFSLFSTWTATLSGAAEVQLEHSYFPEGGGSSWGTDGAFRGALALPESEIPELYRLPALGAKPTFADVSKIPLAQGRFIHQQAVLLKKIRLCIDESLPRVDSAFEEAKELFLDQVAGKKTNGRLFDLEVVTVSKDDEISGNCDVLALQGRWDRFPYRYLPDSTLLARGSWLGKIYGLFYRWDENSLPVITVHPEVTLSYSPPGGRYITEKGHRLIVDGRVLLLHELGHILGFAHIQPDEGAYDFPEATAMGVDPIARDKRGLNLRFEFATDLWKYWDAYQTTIYRRVFQSEINPTCVLPEGDVSPLEGRPLEAVVNEYNSRLDAEKPWGGSPLTEDNVKGAIAEGITRIPEKFCADFQSVFLGKVPDSVAILYLSGTMEYARGAARVPCRFFSPRISIQKELSGYSLRIGASLTEEGATR